MIKNSTLRYFGLEGKGRFSDALSKQYVRDIKEDLLDKRMVAISGLAGAGKTELFKEARLALQGGDRLVQFIRVANEEKERITIGSILQAILLNLKVDPIRRDLEARSIQTVNHLGQQSADKLIVLWVENAHRLHPNTIRAIKDFRENEFNGRSPLLAVALVGQVGLASKIRTYDEVNYRTSSYFLDDSEWLGYDRRQEFLKSVYGDVLSPLQRRRAAARSITFLGMEFEVDRIMTHHQRAGMKQILDDAFEESVKEMYDALQKNYSVSQRAIADAAGVSPGTVNAVVNGKNTKSELVEKVKSSMISLEEQHAGYDRTADKMAAVAGGQ